MTASRPSELYRAPGSKEKIRAFLARSEYRVVAFRHPTPGELYIMTWSDPDGGPRIDEASTWWPPPSQSRLVVQKRGVGRG